MSNEQTVITLRQAEKLLAFFGGHDAEVVVSGPPEGQPDGLYCWMREYPGEGGDFLGATEVDDELASAGRVPTPAEVEAKQWGLSILQKAKDAATDEAARQAWDAFYFKCSPDISLEAWTAIWKKGVAWWSGPVAQEQSKP